jgi:hypothetical protein
MTTVKTALQRIEPRIVTGALASAALGSETSDRVDSAWFPATACTAVVFVKNVGNGDVVTLTLRTARDSSGTGAIDFQATNPAVYSATQATATGTADATVVFPLVVEVGAPTDATYTHMGLRVATSNATGTEIVAGGLERYGNYRADATTY